MNSGGNVGNGYALVDCNNFFVSCERAFQPKLWGKPVLTLSNNDGCVIARSAEVKSLGVKMGEPWFKLRDLAQQHGIVATSSNFVLYGDMSARVMEILRGYSPNVEVYSIDESFLGLAGLRGLWPDWTSFGQHIRKRILQWTSLPVCVGIAPTKTLGKLANHIAKKNPQFNGVCDLYAQSRKERETLFDTIDVGDVWGVGRRIGARLHAAGIKSVQDLRMTPPKWLRAEFGVVMERTANELRGIPCLALEDVPSSKKQIISSRSFGEPVSTEAELGEAVTEFISRAAEKLRRQASTAGVVHVFVMTNRFRESEPQYCNGVSIPLPTPSSNVLRLTQAALAGLKTIFRPGYQYKKAGVMLLDIGPASVVQKDLFEAETESVSERLMHTLDHINSRYGRDTLKVASAAGLQRWAMRREKLSPCYTTRWDETPILHAK